MKITHLFLAVTLISVSLFALFSYIAGEPSQTKKEKTEAPKILAKMISTYSKCKTYTDKGTIVSKFVVKNKNQEINKRRSFTSTHSLRTQFVRPNRFRFEFTYDKKIIMPNSSGYIIWMNNKTVKVWKGFAKDGIEETGNLGHAIAVANGVTNGSSRRIPSLLMPNLELVGLSSLKNLSLTKDIELKKVACFKLTGFMPGGGSKLTLWIDQDTLLIQRIQSLRQLDTSTVVHKTTDYQPEVDSVVPEDQLTFGKIKTGR